MASVNKVILVGHLGRDPESRFTADGSAVANVSLATTETWKDKASGERKEATEWHRLVFFGRLAEVVGEHLKKGAQIYIEGSLKTRKWQDKDGQERQTTEIAVAELKMLGNGHGKATDRPPSHASSARPAGQNSGSGNGGNKSSFEDMDDDIPF